MSVVIRRNGWHEKVEKIADEMNEIIRSRSDRTWRIKDLMEELNARNRLGENVTENEVRLALWQLIDQGDAELTSDRQIAVGQP